MDYGTAPSSATASATAFAQRQEAHVKGQLFAKPLPCETFPNQFLGDLNSNKERDLDGHDDESLREDSPSERRRRGRRRSLVVVVVVMVVVVVAVVMLAVASSWERRTSAACVVHPSLA